MRDACKSIIPCDGNDFWGIMDLLKKEYEDNGSYRGFWGNRRILADALRTDELYVVKLVETDVLYKNRDLFEKEKGSSLHLNTWTIPAFYCSSKGGEILWVDSKFRRCGLGTVLVDYYDIERVHYATMESIPFWDALGIPYDEVV